MTLRAALRSLTVPGALAALLVAAPASRADDPVAASAQGTAIVADAGVTAWRGDDGHIVLQPLGGVAVRTSLRLPAGTRFDVGSRFGGAQLVYTSGCSVRRGTCAVRTAATSQLRVRDRLNPRTLTHIPYRGGGGPAIAIDGSRLVYAVHGTTRSRGKIVDCDVPYVRTFGGSRATTRRLDRGRCATLAQLDLGESRVAVLARPDFRYGSGATEARLIRAAGGRSRTLQTETQGEESNFIGSVSIDRGAVFAARGGIRQADVFTRFSLRTGRRTEARAFAALAGPFARDGGRVHYLEIPSGGSFDCGSAAGAPCLVIAGSDPFGSEPRQLAPQLTLALSPEPVFVDTRPSARVTVTRRIVTRTAQVGAAPVAGLAVELLSARLAPVGSTPTPPAPTGASASTGADGTATIAIPGTPVPHLTLSAVSHPAAGGFRITTPDTIIMQTYVHMTATAERVAGGRLRISGTISPALPGRKVRLDRRLERTCTNVFPGARVTPSTVDTPKGCADRWTQNPLATAAVSADGASYTVEAAAPAGTYRISMDFAGGADVYAGETAPVDAP
jgi:hypothetical protein